jgi:hypothetical protein
MPGNGHLSIWRGAKGKAVAQQCIGKRSTKEAGTAVKPGNTRSTNPGLPHSPYQS